MGADGWLCSLLYDVQQALSLGPCIDAVHGAPGHNRRESGGDATPCKVTREDRGLSF